MTVDALPSTRKTLTTSQAVLFGTLVVGTLDILDAFLFNWFRSGVTGPDPAGHRFGCARAGVLQRRSCHRGARPAAPLLHRLRGRDPLHPCQPAAAGLAQRPFVLGPIYGLLVHLVMHYVVVPLSAVTRAPGPMPLAVHVNQWLIHAFGIGLVTALFARAARRF